MLLALFVMAVALPNAGKIVIDPTSPATPRVEGRLSQGVIIVVLALLPVVCIVFLGRRKLIVEIVGWIFLLYLVSGTFLK